VSLVFDMTDPAERVRGLDAATSAVRRGDLVVLPTDTVYGVGTDAFGTTGVSRLRAAKGMPAGAPLPVLVGSPTTMEGLGYGLTKAARSLVEAFWPGALTVVVKAQPTLAWDIGGTDGRVALRMPLHPVAIELLRATGPMAVTGANLAQRPQPATCLQARDQLGDSVTVYLDAGIGLDLPPSTVVDASGEVPVVLRVGAVTVDTLREVCPQVVEGQ